MIHSFVAACLCLPALSFCSGLASQSGMVRVIVLQLLFLAFAAISPAMAETRVFAAASLRGGLEAALGASGARARISFGGSGAIARQVVLGAPADLVLLANPDWDTWLAEQTGAGIAPVSFLQNRLVLIGPKGAKAFEMRPDGAALQARLGGGRLAMGARNSVPAGQYAKAWLTHIDAWDALLPALAEAPNVRAALAYVALGEAPLGLVYATDAQAEEAVSVLWPVAEGHPTISYTARARSEAGEALLDLLLAAPAQRAFADHGFLPVAGAPE